MYKTFSSSNEYERALLSVCLRCRDTDLYDIYSLYISLEEIAQKFISEGKMKEHDTFDVPIENGSALRFEFFIDHTDLYIFLKDESESISLIKDSSPSATKKIIQAYAIAIKSSYYGIGFGCPAIFKDVLYSLRAGEIIKFDNDTAFICIENTNTTKIKEVHESYKYIGHTIALQEIFFDNNSHSINDIKLSDKFRVSETSMRDLQFVFRKVCDSLDPSFTYKISKPNNTDKKIENNIYYALNGWLNATPLSFHFFRESPSYETEIKDLEIKERLYEACNNKYYDKARDILKKYCEEDNSLTAAYLSTYKKGENNYHASSIFFKYDPDTNNVLILELSYEDGFNSDISSIEQISDADFENICTSLFEDVVIIQNGPVLREHNLIFNT